MCSDREWATKLLEEQALLVLQATVFESAVTPSPSGSSLNWRARRRRFLRVLVNAVACQSGVKNGQ